MEACDESVGVISLVGEQSSWLHQGGGDFGLFDIVDIAAGQGTAHRELEGATETVTFPLPAVLTIDEGIARPRLPSLKGIMAAKKKPIESRPAVLGQVTLTVEKLELPPVRAAGRIVGEGPDAVPELIRLLRDEAKVL